MSTYLLDTDWVVDVLNGQVTATQTLVDLAPDGLALSVISYGELYEGAYFSRDPQTALEVLRTFLEGKGALAAHHRDYGAVCYTSRQNLPRKLRQQIGDMDILIAATAVENNLTLLTRNLKDFQHISQLKVYQPGQHTS